MSDDFTDIVGTDVRLWKIVPCGKHIREWHCLRCPRKLLTGRNGPSTGWLENASCPRETHPDCGLEAYRREHGE